MNNIINKYLISRFYSLYKENLFKIHNKFLLLKNPLSLKEQITWKLVIKTKGLGVWVYDFNKRNLIEYFDSVKACREKYNIPLTTFKRLRKHQLNYKGYLFSDFQL